MLTHGSVLRSLTLVLASMVFAACAAPVGEDVGTEEEAIVPAGPPAVIFDTDMDFDDAAALAYLAAAHKAGLISLRAVTVTNNGSGYPGKSIRNARCILERVGLARQVPVADGSNTGENVFPPAIRDGIGAVLDRLTAGCTASEAPSSESAAALLARVVRSSKAPVTLVATGPLSNVAAALDADPRLAKRISAAFVMGGAVRVPGNLCCGVAEGSFDNTQEFNVWIDATSAKTTLQRLRPGTVRLVPLDATKDVPLALAYVDRINAEARTEEARIVAAITQDPGVKNDIPAGFLFWWDTLDTVALTHPEVVTFENQTLEVTTTGASVGRTTLAKGGAFVRLAVAADRAAFEETFLSVLNGGATTSASAN